MLPSSYPSSQTHIHHFSEPLKNDLDRSPVSVDVSRMVQCEQTSAELLFLMYSYQQHTLK